MHRATGFHHQPRQQGILFRRKIQRRFTQPHRAASDVKAQIADADFIIAPGCYAGGAGRECAH